jgi:hypothetical protein
MQILSTIKIGRKVTFFAATLVVAGVALSSGLAGRLGSMLEGARYLSRVGTALSVAGEATLSAWGYGEATVGVVTDSRCALYHHPIENAQCVRVCVSLGGKYLLDDGKGLYELSDQRGAERYAARKVKVRGLVENGSQYLKLISIEPL